MTISRRQFLASSALTVGSWAAPSAIARLGAAAAADRSAARKTLAVVTTTYFVRSHAYHIAGRFLHGYTVQGKHHQPNHELVSMYVEQVGEKDLSRGLAKKFGFRLCDTVRETLTLDSEHLDVDAVLLIGEHGNYPRNKYGQTLYPRHRLMSEIVAEFRRSDRSVPVFNDKHLSYSWEKSQEMYDWSRELNFPFQAGSSLPVTWRLPELELPLGTKIEEALVVAHGGADSYGFHALETLQCHLERRAGGETGLASVQALTGEDVWKAEQQGRWNRELFQAALSRSRTLNIGTPQHNVRNPVAFLLEYRDGLRATVLLLNEHVADFTFAAKLSGQSRPVSTLHYLPAPPGAKFFDPLTYNIERMLDEGRAVIPVERTLLVSGALDALMHSRYQDSQRRETPHLEIAYQAPENSGFFRGAIDLAGQLGG